MAIEILTDGSYAKKTVGIGCVIINKNAESPTISFDAFSKAIYLPRISKYGSQGAEALAVIHALNTLYEKGYTGDIIVYCDCNVITDYINGPPQKFADDITHIKEELEQCITRHSSVTAQHPKHAKHLPWYLPAIAHNASAIASGANKREKTTPDYNGEFSSPISTKSVKDAFHRHSKTNNRNRRSPSTLRANAFNI